MLFGYTIQYLLWSIAIYRNVRVSIYVRSFHSNTEAITYICRCDWVPLGTTPCFVCLFGPGATPEAFAFPPWRASSCQRPVPPWLTSPGWRCLGRRCLLSIESMRNLSIRAVSLSVKSLKQDTIDGRWLPVWLHSKTRGWPFFTPCCLPDSFSTLQWICWWKGKGFEVNDTLTQHPAGMAQIPE